jgi:crossover junction endodeoxyribonuclease RuvC
MVILGIDPGLATVGYGVVRSESSVLRALDYGTINTPAGMPMPQRLERIYQGMTQLIEAYQPDHISFEELFFYHNVTTAIAVGQARGVLVLGGQQSGRPLYEYTPMQIKQSVCGYGHADKKQVQQMVRVLLCLNKTPQPDDAADALACAICHANTAGPMMEEFRIK